MDTKRKRISVVVGSALAAAAIVTGTAIGANGGSSPAPASPPAATAQQAPATTAPTAPTTPTPEAPSTAPDPAGAPNAEGPDASAPESAVENPAAENAPEQSEPNEPALPGGGHADAPGQNVDHQFNGVE